MAEISMFDPAMLVWVDESGHNRKNTIRTYGYSIRGMAARDYRLKFGGVRVNTIGVISIFGMEDIYLVEDTVNVETFEDFCRKCLLPLLLPFNGINTHSVVIMDNCSIHHVDTVTDMIHSSGALIRYLPPYSPDLNPIEFVFSKVKAFIGANETVFLYSPLAVVSMAFNTITEQDCINYAHHCGYIWK